MIVHFSDSRLLTKNFNWNTTTKLITKQVGFRQDSAQSLQEKFMKYSKIRPSCTISKTKDDGMSIDMLGCMWIKNVKKFPMPILQLAFFGVKLPRFVEPLIG